MKTRIFEVRIVTTQHGDDISFGADLLISSQVYAFKDEVTAREAFVHLQHEAEDLRGYPGTEVEVLMEEDSI